MIELDYPASYAKGRRNKLCCKLHESNQDMLGGCVDPHFRGTEGGWPNTLLLEQTTKHTRGSRNYATVLLSGRFLTPRPPEKEKHEHEDQHEHGISSTSTGVWHGKIMEGGHSHTSKANLLHTKYLLDDAIKQLPAEQVLEHHIVVGGVFRVELVDVYHVRVLELAEDLHLLV